MNAKIFTVVGALVFSAVFVGSTVFAEDLMNYPVGPASEVTSLMGKTVNDESGNYLGKISDFVIDEANNRVSLVVLNGVPGFGSDRVSFPYQCLQRNGDKTFSIRFASGVVTGSARGQDPYLQTLRQYPADSPLYKIPEPVAPNSVAEVYRTYGYLPYWVQKGEKAPSAADLTETAQLVGTKVEVTGGKVSARIDDMTIDSSSRLDLLVLSNVPGRGSHEVAVPFEALKRTSDGSLALKVGGERLAMAPVFNKSYANTLGYDERVDRFFGLSPHWTVKQQEESNPYRWGGEAQEF